MGFKRDTKTHQLVITKDNQIAANYNENGINVDFIAELEIIGKGQISINYYFDPEITLTSAQKGEVADFFREDVKKRFLEGGEL